MSIFAVSLIVGLTRNVHSWYFIIMLIAETTMARTIQKLCLNQHEDKQICEKHLSDTKIFFGCTINLNFSTDDRSAQVVYACSWSESFINPEEILNNFPVVEKLIITNGNVKEFRTNFPRSLHLNYLILSNLNIKHLRSVLFMNLEKLEFLDLSENCLQQLSPDIITNLPLLMKINLTGNPWNCLLDFKWILNKSINSKILNKYHLNCGQGIYSGKPVYYVMSFIKKIEKSCPHVCSCMLNNLVWETQQSYLVPVISVNCSNRNLTELPGKLPVNTTTLLLKENNINDLSSLIHNKIYSTVSDIYLDYNHVKNIDVLEGAIWLEKFRVMSLKGNNLTEIPVYALDNAFQKNSHMAKIYLGQNPWQCDCSFTPDFQNLLIKYSSVIKDKSDITCSERTNDQNSKLEIIKLSINSLCRKSSHSINTLDVLSAIFASLLVLILGKLAYDSWTFKRTGKLPWIVTKIPW